MTELSLPSYSSPSSPGVMWPGQKPGNPHIPGQCSRVLTHNTVGCSFPRLPHCLTDADDYVDLDSPTEKQTCSPHLYTHTQASKTDTGTHTQTHTRMDGNKHKTHHQKYTYRQVCIGTNTQPPSIVPIPTSCCYASLRVGRAATRPTRKNHYN